MNKYMTLAFMILGLAAPTSLLAANSTDQTVASFERDLDREPAATDYIVQAEVDPVQYLVNSGLSRASDQTVASFERDLDREPAATDYIVQAEVDPVQYLVNSGLSRASDQTVASFERDLNTRIASADAQGITFGMDLLDAVRTTPWWMPRGVTALA